MKNYWLLLCALLLISSCTTDSKVSDISAYIPNSSILVLKTKNIKGLRGNLKNSDFFKKLSALESYQNLEKKLQPLSLLNTDNDILIALSKSSKDSLDVVFTTKYRDSIFNFSDSKNYSSESLKFNSSSIEKIVLNDQAFYYTVKDSILVASSNIEWIKNLKPNPKTNSQVADLMKASSSEASFSLYIDNSYYQEKPFFLLDSVLVPDFSKATLVDVNISQDQILLNGITQASDSTKSLINIFKDSKPRENQMAKIAPSNVDGFVSFTFDSFKSFHTNLKKYQTQKGYAVTDSILDSETLFDNIIEVGVLFEGTQHSVILNSLDEMITDDALLAFKDVAETYRDVTIWKYGKPTAFKEAFFPLVTFDDLNFYAQIDNYFIFSSSMESLENVISSYQNTTVFATRNGYKDIQSQLSDAASLLLLFNDDTLSGFFAENETADLGNYKTSALQFIYDHHFAHTNMVIKRLKARVDANTVSEEFNIKLDADILTNPQFVTNYTNNQKDIVVQDVNNNLYLLSNTGEILFKKKLEGAILGKVNQVDIYKNGRLQLAFATPNRVYIIDRTGKEVSPFPLKFNDPITQPLSVFDYDSNRNYRLMVTQGSHVLMYDLSGKIVKGFEFSSANATILSQPKHFRIGGKDYIVLKTKDKLYILDRRGDSRVKPKSTANFSSEDIYVYNGLFATTTTDGDLFSVDTKGNTSTESLNLNTQHHMDATSKTLAAITDNKLRIKSNTVELDFGIYSVPKIFYINDKIYVSVTDMQTNKVYLFDSLGKPLPNFPVYGNSAIDMDNADGDRNPEIIVKSGTDELLMYQVN